MKKIFVVMMTLALLLSLPMEVLGSGNVTVTQPLE